MTVAGIAGFATRLLGQRTTNNQQTTVDLKSQFEAMQKAISMPKPQFIQKMNWSTSVFVQRDGSCYF